VKKKHLYQFSRDKNFSRGEKKKAQVLFFFEEEAKLDHPN